jgi:NTP pyrophosphatase (non-canonical NTP hydrolase)
MSKKWEEYKNFVNGKWFEGVEKNNKILENSSLLFASLGLAGECGEFIEVIKKGHRVGREIDNEKAISEAGDVFFYYTKILNELGITLEDVIEYNIRKLNKRYQ